MSFATAIPAQKPKPDQTKHGVRRDIQGLRAFAVLAVFADHLLGWPSGGFVGVDIFFVISGFLITGILLREYEKTGHISFTGFYTRRVRRIIPAAMVTIIVTVGISFLIYPASKAMGILIDGLAATFFVGNWRFAASGTDYFAQGAPSPLQNFWSLAVEEQFYFVWPWLMLAVLLIGTRLMRRSAAAATNVAGLLMLVAVGASFVWAMSQSVADPTVAYFSTLTRVWELGVGALLAIFGRVFFYMAMPARIVIAWTGIAVMIGSLFLITPEMPFPAPWAAIPVIGTAMVLAAGIGQEPVGNVLLTNPVSRYIGDMSYSLYLWHWPVIILATSLYPDGGIWLLLGATGVGFAISIVSYEAIEKPINESPLFKSYPRRSVRRREWRQWADDKLPRAGRVSALVLSIVSIVLITIAIVAPPGYISADEAKKMQAEWAAAQQTAEPGAEEPQRDAVAQGIADAVTARAWPAALNPSIDTVAVDGMPAESSMDCDDPAVDATSCTFGSGGPSILIYGDSLGGTLLPTIRAAYEGDHRIRGLALSACAVTDLAVEFKSAEIEADCMRHREAVVEYVTAQRPDVVFVIQNYAWADKLLSKAKGTALQSEWTAATTALNDKLLAAGAGKVVFVSPPPEGKSIIDCATLTASPDTCESPIPESWQVVHRAESALPILYMDETDWFCFNGTCPVMNGDTITRRDAVHPTRQYSEAIASVWRTRADELLAAQQ